MNIVDTIESLHDVSFLIEGLLGFKVELLKSDVFLYLIDKPLHHIMD